MFAIASARFFNCSKFIANIVFILFIARVVTSLNVSDVSGRARTTSCSIRLTRQKVLIQEIENPGNSVKKRRATDKYGILKLHEHLPPNIIVEELPIRAKIHFQASPRTCRNFPTTNMNYTKSRIDSLKFLPRRIICCYASSVIQNNAQRFKVESSIEQSYDEPNNISQNGRIKNKKISLRATTLLPYTKIVHLSKKANNISLFANDEENPLQNVIFNNTESFGMSNLEVGKNTSLLYSRTKEYHKLAKRGAKFGCGRRFRRSIKSMENKPSRLAKISHVSKQVSNKMNIHYRGTRRKEFVPDSKTHNHNKGKTNISSDAIHGMMSEIPSWNKNYGDSEILPDEKNSITFVPFFDDYEVGEIPNNKLDRPRSLFIPDELKKRLQENSKVNEKSLISHSWQKKSEKILNRDKLPVEVEKRSASIDLQSDMKFPDEQEKFDSKYDHSDMRPPLSDSYYYGEKIDELYRETNKSDAPVQNKKSSQTPKNNKVVSSIDNQENISKSSSTNTNVRKKPRSENSSEKEIGQQSNNTAWNFIIPPVFAKYISYVASFYTPLFGVEAIANNNQSELTREENSETHSFNVSPDESGKYVSAENSNTLPYNRTKFARMFPGNFFPTFTIDYYLNSTSNDLTNSIKTFPTNSTDIIFANISKIYSINSTHNHHAALDRSTILNSMQNSDRILLNDTFPISAKNVRKAMEENDRFFTETKVKRIVPTTRPTTRQTFQSVHFENSPKIYDNSEKYFSKGLTERKDENLEMTNFYKSMETILSKDSANYSISMDDKNNEPVSRIGKRISAMANLPLAENNTRKLWNPTESIIKLIKNSPNDLMKNSRVTTSSTSDDFSDKTTVNFTIIDPNCNPPMNNTADQSPIIVEIIVPTSTYPTVKRYSRNDTVKVQHRQNNDGKARQTKNMLNDSRSPNTGKKVRGGITMTRRKNRIRIEGKHPVLVNSPMQNGKNLWRKYNESLTSNRTKQLNFYGLPIARENGKSTSTLVSPSVIWREIQISSTSPPVNSPSVKTDVDSSKIPIELSSTESSSSDPREKITIDTPPPTFSNDDNFSKDTNDSYSNNSKLKLPMSTPSLITVTDAKLTNFFTITAGTKSMKADNEARQDEAIKIEETSAGTLTNQSSTLLYDKFIPVDPSGAKRKNNSTIAKDLAMKNGEETGRDGKNSKQPIVDIIRNDNITNMANASVKFENLPETTGFSLSTEESRQELNGLTNINILNNNVTDESPTFSYDRANFTESSVIDEIVPKKNKITIGESSSVMANEIMVEEQNSTLSTVDEIIGSDARKTFLRVDPTKNQTNTASMTEETQKYFSTTEQKIPSEYSSIFLNSSEKSPDTKLGKNSTQFVLPMKINASKESLDEIFSIKRNFSLTKEISGLSTNSPISNYNSQSIRNYSEHLENSVEVNVAPSINNQNFTKQKLTKIFGSVLETPTESQSRPEIENKTIGTVLLPEISLGRSARETRLTTDNEIIGNDDHVEREFDLKSNSSVGILMLTEKIPKTIELTMEVQKAEG